MQRLFGQQALVFQQILPASSKPLPDIAEIQDLTPFYFVVVKGYISRGVIHRVLRALRDFALRAAPAHFGLGLKSLRARTSYGQLRASLLCTKMENG